MAQQGCRNRVAQADGQDPSGQSDQPQVNSARLQHCPGTIFTCPQPYTPPPPPSLSWQISHSPTWRTCQTAYPSKPDKILFVWVFMFNIFPRNAKLAFLFFCPPTFSGFKTTCCLVVRWRGFSPSRLATFLKCQELGNVCTSLRKCVIMDFFWVIMN